MWFLNSGSSAGNFIAILTYLLHTPLAHTTPTMATRLLLVLWLLHIGPLSFGCFSTQILALFGFIFLNYWKTKSPSLYCIIAPIACNVYILHWLCSFFHPLSGRQQCQAVQPSFYNSFLYRGRGFAKLPLPGEASSLLVLIFWFLSCTVLAGTYLVLCQSEA